MFSVSNDWSNVAFARKRRLFLLMVRSRTGFSLLKSSWQNPQALGLRVSWSDEHITQPQLSRVSLEKLVLRVSTLRILVWGASGEESIVIWNCPFIFGYMHYPYPAKSCKWCNVLRFSKKYLLTADELLNYDDPWVSNSHNNEITLRKQRRHWLQDIMNSGRAPVSLRRYHKIKISKRQSRNLQAHKW